MLHILVLGVSIVTIVYIAVSVVFTQINFARTIDRVPGLNFQRVFDDTS